MISSQQEYPARSVRGESFTHFSMAVGVPVVAKHHIEPIVNSDDGDDVTASGSQVDSPMTGLLRRPSLKFLLNGIQGAYLARQTPHGRVPQTPSGWNPQSPQGLSPCSHEHDLNPLVPCQQSPLERASQGLSLSTML